MFSKPKIILTMLHPPFRTWVVKRILCFMRFSNIIFRLFCCCISVAERLKCTSYTSFWNTNGVYIYIYISLCVCVYTFSLILLIEPQEYVFVADDSTWSMNIFQLVVLALQEDIVTLFCLPVSIKCKIHWRFS